MYLTSKGLIISADNDSFFGINTQSDSRSNKSVHLFLSSGIFH